MPRFPSRSLDSVMHRLSDPAWGWTISGKALGFMQASFLGANFEYCYVARTWASKDRAVVCVSTFYVVMDGRFETMVFVETPAGRRPVPSGSGECHLRGRLRS